MTKREMLSYVAGTVDSDGHVSIQRLNKKARSGRGSYVNYTPKIGVSQTERAAVVLMKRLFGGAIYEYQPRKAGHKKWFMWLATDARASVVLEAILPFLLLKKRQAELAIKLQRLKERQRIEMKGKGGRYHMTYKMICDRHNLWTRVTLLNKPRNRRVHFLGTPARRTLAAIR